MPNSLYTIGHSNHPISRFISLLTDCGITALADVRSHPYSRHSPQYSKDALKPALQLAGIAYVFLGKELGARSENPACYREGKVQYELLAKEPLFKEGIERLHFGIQNNSIAIMCSEKDPLDCHRAILVARRIHEKGVLVRHILADGRIESHSDLEARMLKNLKMPAMDLFRSSDEILIEAYTRHGQHIAYEDESMAQKEFQEGSLL